ncbi:hypothetical protein MKW98_024101, partial [Papaver atlanticum]
SPLANLWPPSWCGLKRGLSRLYGRAGPGGVAAGTDRVWQQRWLTVNCYEWLR